MEHIRESRYDNHSEYSVMITASTNGTRNDEVVNLKPGNKDKENGDSCDSN